MDFTFESARRLREDAGLNGENGAKEVWLFAVIAVVIVLAAAIQPGRLAYHRYKEAAA
ncbi:MAG: hypothetical protein MUF81_06575 [Verrucomicrobia bacterium]|nr:hypothetical protein [Verrucomicrobiota bacterium]